MEPVDTLSEGQIFADIVEAAGYTVGIYANENWYKTIIGSALDKYTKWVAKYSSKAPKVRTWTSGSIQAPEACQD